eukprot:scaffold17472_cov105-Isochrysis_galbana.AAC.1
MRTVRSHEPRKNSSHVSAWTSRWLVGSSSSSRSGLRKRAWGWGAGGGGGGGRAGLVMQGWHSEELKAQMESPPEVAEGREAARGDTLSRPALRTCANTMRIRQPPECDRVGICIISWSNPSPDRRDAARASALSESSSSSRS